MTRATVRARVASRRTVSAALPLATVVALAGCGRRASERVDPAAVATVVEFGHRLKGVPLLAPADIARREIRARYADLVDATLLAAWLRDPRVAPGREVSSPWPDRIDVTSAARAGKDEVRVTGRIVEMTSADHGAPVRTIPVRVTVARQTAGWRITAYMEAPAEGVAGGPAAGGGTPDGGVDSSAAHLPAAADLSETGAAAIVAAYYAAINAQDYRRAYECWENGGQSSGHSFDDFVRGFRETAAVRAELAVPSRIGAAAGSRYVTVPVSITAWTRQGQIQRFAGTYVLRRAVVDGATPEQRRWHIYSASVRRVGAS